VAFLSGPAQRRVGLAHPRAAAVRIAARFSRRSSSAANREELARSCKRLPLKSTGSRRRPPAGAAFSSRVAAGHRVPLAHLLRTLVTFGISLCFRTPEAQRRVVASISRSRRWCSWGSAIRAPESPPSARDLLCNRFPPARHFHAAARLPAPPARHEIVAQMHESSASRSHRNQPDGTPAASQEPL